MGRKIGKVYLIGAGPGDKGLMTVKGKECLNQCDVVVYDALVNTEILQWVSPRAKKIYAGKRGSALGKSHKTDQKKINDLMVQYAQSGKIVARLKGGDPFLFGRGGEEAEVLAKHQIPFEIVPGVSSVTAVPAYAGIPVTDRRYTSMFTVVTGHSAEDFYKGPQVEWNKIAPSGTLVILMGVGQLNWIIRKLKQLKWPTAMPTACIRWGTTQDQRVIEGTIGDIIKKIKSARPVFTPPAVIVVGSVVKMREKIQWFIPKNR